MLESLGYGPPSNSSGAESSIPIHGSRAVTVQKILEDVHHLDPEVNTTDVEQWLSVDINSHGFEEMTDEEIVQQVRECHTSSLGTQAESESEEEECLIPCSNREAMQMADTLLYWLESQPEANPCHLMFMRQVKEIALKKIVLRQTTIDSYFLYKLYTQKSSCNCFYLIHVYLFCLII